MTPPRVGERIKALDMRLRSIQTRICDASRALIPVLRDAQREHSAKQLVELFFELDALTQEMSEFVRSNLDGLVKSIMEPGRGGE
jgi:hypothetical protein